VEEITAPQMKALGYKQIIAAKPSCLAYRIFDEFGLHAFSYIRRMLLSDPKDSWSRARNAMARKIRRRRFN